MWSRDGRELYFLTRDSRSLMAVGISTHPELSTSTPRELFSGNFGRVPGVPMNYDVAPDGRFLMVVEEDVPESQPQVHVILDFGEELTRQFDETQ